MAQVGSANPSLGFFSLSASLPLFLYSYTVTEACDLIL